MIKYETIDFLGGHLTAFERDGHLVLSVWPTMG